MTSQRIAELSADPMRIREAGIDELAELLTLARTALGLEAQNAIAEPPPLERLMGMVPSFDDRWTPENKDQWFAGMAKLIAAAS